MSDVSFVFLYKLRKVQNDVFQALDVTINQDFYTQQGIKSSIRITG